MHRLSITALALTTCFFVSTGFAQQTSGSSLLAADTAAGSGYISSITPPSGQSGPFSRLGVGVQAGLLGPGIEVATPLFRGLNLRVGGNFLDFSHSGATSGVNYAANLRLRSAVGSVDWYPWGRSFYVSPGALVYDGNEITGNALIPAGDSFTLNGTDYVSDPADPVNGSGSLKFPRLAPKFTIGWGSLVPRGERHVSFPFEMGFAYLGQPTTVLTFAGSVCDSGMQGCQSIASDPTAQANVAAEQQKLQKDANYARFFPLISQGFALRF